MYREFDSCLLANSNYGVDAYRDYAILPRRKAGQSVPLGERAPVLLTKEVLANYFKMPLSAAAKELVSIEISSTVVSDKEKKLTFD